MNVCIIGGGHIGTALASYIKHNCPNNIVSLRVGDSSRFDETIVCNDIEKQETFRVVPDLITSDYASAVQDADCILIALPHFLIEKTFSGIAPHVKDGVFVGVIPASGGCEFFFDKYFCGKAHLFGFQRVPFTAKIVEYGKEVNLKSWKPNSTIGALKREDLDTACKLVQNCGLKTKQAANFLAVSLVPSNPILHTSRTYEIFGSYKNDFEFDERQKYYVGWTDGASKTMIDMDKELHKLFDEIPSLDMSSVLPLTEHYEAPTIEAMTKKINSIPTFQTVYAPMKPSPYTEGKWVPDLSSRMFTEDFPWGLCIIRAYCEIFGVSCPTIDRVLHWFEDYMGLEYYIDGRFCGFDLKNTGIPQNFGITEPNSVLSLYSR